MEKKRSIMMKEMENWLEKFNDHTVQYSANANNFEGQLFLTAVHHLFRLISQVF